MLLKNLKFTFKYFPIPALLIFFVLSRSILLVHSFSHQKIGHEHKVEQAAFSQQNILEKIIFAHFGDSSDSTNKAVNCALCALANFQNQILFSASLSFVIMAFYLAFISRYFDRNKLSYLLSSYSSRAPPRIS